MLTYRVPIVIKGYAFLRGQRMRATPPCTVYFDGACPVCRREIAQYRRRSGADAMTWIDASSCDETALPGLDRSVVLRRFHVQEADGRIVSGAAAFVAIWRRLPAFAWLAALTSSRPALALLDAGYSVFLKVRRLWRQADRSVVENVRKVRLVTCTDTAERMPRKADFVARAD